ncbi:hypothetical protein [Bradyrhizobium sp.]|uniref:hypothetical protein n=1 Tax=Bradyrhizobium sp. TaxID=376 RepID=UPI002733D91F|nr:hypothetical protein [Bradyrhizobium sp.]MDP3075445.1 hypothetical protein [Bradyrhizobium sp.]
MQAGFALRDANQLPLHLVFAGGLAGGLGGGVASGVAWLALGNLLWLPYWRQLRDHGMNADDNGWAMGFIFVPPVMGVAFLISTLVSLLIVRWIAYPKLVLILLNSVPGLLLTLNGTNEIIHGRYWEYPGFEIACLLIGFAWGVALFELMVRRGGYVEG